MDFTLSDLHSSLSFQLPTSLCDCMQHFVFWVLYCFLYAGKKTLKNISLIVIVLVCLVCSLSQWIVYLHLHAEALFKSEVEAM
ncbi:Uncharacterized protein TCM_001366 [Theobroma cacao]|uniref:Uncharacterized protein n=1 Tax=Theobroma cacao TaxID=3641 RepID=A0A061DR26_THECC|nr:Uncharacterized protein TCM_001366 [Theobroma cacao]